VWRTALGGAGGLRAREEVDVDAAHAAATELDIARAASSIGARRLAAPKCGEQGSGDDARRPSAKTPALGTPTVATSPIAYTPGYCVSRVLELTGT